MSTSSYYPACSCPGGTPNSALGRHNQCQLHGLAAQAAGSPFVQQFQADNTPLSHMEILSAVAHHAREIVRLTAAIPVACSPVEPSDEPAPDLATPKA